MSEGTGLYLQGHSWRLSFGWRVSLETAVAAKWLLLNKLCCRSILYVNKAGQWITISFSVLCWFFNFVFFLVTWRDSSWMQMSICSYVKRIGLIEKNRIVLVGRDLQWSSSPTAQPLQGWTEAKPYYRLFQMPFVHSQTWGIQLQQEACSNVWPPSQ